MNLSEALLTGATILVLCLYHLHLYIKVRQNPKTTAVGMTNFIRQQWVETIMAERRDILAVQTLRNWDSQHSVASVRFSGDHPCVEHCRNTQRNPLGP